MIEAVNSSLSSSVVSRGLSTQQASSVQGAGINAATSAVDTSSVPKAPFISPFISVDPGLNKAVILIRNADTGDVEQQFPTKSRLQELRQQRAREESAQNAAASGANSVSTASQPSSASIQNQGSDLVSLQDITASAAPVNTGTPVPEVAAAALSAGAQSGQPPQSAGVSVLV